jgi:hypothetical protein
VAHQHNPACYARDGGREFLTCGQRVHSHVGSCYRKFLTCGK